MKSRMKFAPIEISRHKPSLKYTLLVSIVVFGLLSVASAQQRMSKRFPVDDNVRIVLKNMFGTIVVESWNRDEVKLTASFDSPKATITPRQSGDSLIIDVVADNRGRMDVGDVNFKLMVPARSAVDLHTKRGQITVSNISGDWVRAHVSLEGDIELMGINAMEVYAQNTTGDIFFDGAFSKGGTYQFQSNKGEITIRIPMDSAFNLVASAQNRRIQLGQFWNNRIQNYGDGRKFVGDVGDGKSKVSVTSFQGSITFLRR